MISNTDLNEQQYHGVNDIIMRQSTAIWILLFEAYLWLYFDMLCNIDNAKEKNRQVGHTVREHNENPNPT